MTARDPALGAQIITVEGTDTTARFDFWIPKTFTSYPVLLKPIRFTGEPPMAAFIPTAITKDMDGFTVTVGAAPGSGASVTFELGITL